MNIAIGGCILVPPLTANWDAQDFDPSFPGIVSE